MDDDMKEEQETMTTDEGFTAHDKARERYDSVNARWPDTLPEMTPEEAIRVAKRLYRFAMKRPWRGEWQATSGNRSTWPRGGVFRVNYTGHYRAAWRDLVHDISHYVHRQRHPRARPHDIRHEILEREMVEYVVRSGWLDGRLKAKQKTAPSKEARDATRLTHARAMLAKSLTREKRAATLRKKWARRVRALERKGTENAG